MKTNSTNIDRLKEELAALVEMSEAEACRQYKVDDKAEAVPYIVDYWI